jgi:hypothetical protein
VVTISDDDGMGSPIGEASASPPGISCSFIPFWRPFPLIALNNPVPAGRVVMVVPSSILIRRGGSGFNTPAQKRFCRFSRSLAEEKESQCILFWWKEADSPCAHIAAPIWFDIANRMPMIGRPSSRAEAKPKTVDWGKHQRSWENTRRAGHTPVIPLSFLHICRDLIWCHILGLEVLN